MTYWQRIIAPWLAWRAKREYQRQIERKRRQRAVVFESEFSRLDLMEAEAKRLHRPVTPIVKQKKQLRTQMLREGL